MIFFNFRRAQLALLGAGSRMEEARALLLKRVESRHNNTTNDSSNSKAENENGTSALAKGR